MFSYARNVYINMILLSFFLGIFFSNIDSHYGIMHNTGARGRVIGIATHRDLTDKTNHITRFIDLSLV